MESIFHALFKKDKNCPWLLQELWNEASKSPNARQEQTAVIDSCVVVMSVSDKGQKRHSDILFATFHILYVLHFFMFNFNFFIYYILVHISIFICTTFFIFNFVWL